MTWPDKPNGTYNSAHPLASGLIRYWQLHEGAGTQVTDLVASQTIDWSGQPSYQTPSGWVAGEGGVGLAHNGNNNVKVVGVWGAAEPTAWTMAALVDLPADGSGHIASFGAGTVPYRSLDIHEGTARFSRRETSYAFHHVSGTTDLRGSVSLLHTVRVSDAEARVYANGALEGVGVDANVTLSATDMANIEWLNNASSSNDGFLGRLLGIWIWDVALTESQVADHVADVWLAGGGSPTPAYRPFDRFRRLVPGVIRPFDRYRQSRRIS